MRISNLWIQQNTIRNTSQNTEKMVRVQKQLLTSQKNLAPSDNLNDTITSLYQRVRITQIDQYQQNIEAVQSHINIAHDKLSATNEITRSIRTLAIQAANGPLTDFDRQTIAIQVEELINELANIANSTYEDNFLFAGSKTDNMPFHVTKTFDPKFGKDVVSKVDYLGDRIGLKRSIGNNEQITLTNSGAEIFWAQNYTVASSTDAENYISTRDQKIMVDGYGVQIELGDNLDTIVEKITANVPSVKAFVQEWPTGERGLAIESTFPKKIALEDVEGGTLLRELGILKIGPRGDAPYDNIRETALVRDGSLFEALIRMRNSIVDGRLERIGGRDLAALDQGYKNVLKAQGQLSSTKMRIDYVAQDLAKEKEYVVERKSQADDLDIVDASVRYNQLANVHRISLQTAAKLVRPTLLDYL